jgi:hypothetical protein
MTTVATVSPIPHRVSEIDEIKIPEPMWSVKSRVSWGALFAGGVVAVAIYFLMSLLGVALGVTFSDRFNAEQLGTAAAYYTFASLLISMFFGGWVSTRCTAGEYRGEAALYGIVVWGICSSILVPLTALGVGSGVSTVLASQGIAKLKTEVIPPVVNAENLAREKVDTAKKEVNAAKKKVEQAVNGNKSEDEGKSDRKDDSTSTSGDSGSRSSDNKSSSDASSSDENDSNQGRESTSTDDSSQSSTTLTSDKRRDRDARQDKSDKASTDDEMANDKSKTHHQTREELIAASWWAFGGTFLSLMAAVLGAVMGPTISVVRHKIPAGASTTVVARPAQL